MEESLKVASLSLDETPVANGEDGKLLAFNDSHEDGSLKDESCWADSDEEGDGSSELDREWERRRERFYNAGYRDGISAGKNDAVQAGFNQGFKDSVMAGYKWGVVRGVTSALANLPNELKEKLVESEEVRRELLNLHGAVDSIGTQAALKCFYDDFQSVTSSEPNKDVEPPSSRTHQTGFELSDVGNYLGKLELVLKESPVANLHLDLNVNRVP